MYETWLIPYLEGTLDAEQRAQLEARLPDDPALASELNALRRAEPRLRAVAGRLRRSEAVRSAAGPLWPGLRGRLDVRPARPVFGPALWWAGGGVCAASLLVLAVLRGPVLHPEGTDRKTARAYRNAPLIVSHPDDGVGAPVAERLRARAERVAAEQRAAGTGGQTLVADRPPPARTLPLPAAPSSLPVAPPPAAARPLRMAKREPDTLLPYPVALPPAPTHSPPAPAPAFAPALAPPAPTHSPPPGPGQSEVPAGAVSDAPPAAPAGEAAVSAGADGGDAAGPPPVARQYLPLNGSVRVALPPPATLRQRLEQALTPPVYGTDAGEAREQGLLRAAQRGAAGAALRAALDAEAADAQPSASARLRAALDEEGGDWKGAAARWRRLVRRPDAVAEDWFRLAQAETRLGHAEAARRAYAQSLQPGPFPLSAAHRGLSLQNAPPAGPARP